MTDFKEFERLRGKRGLVMGLGVFGGGIESAKFLARYCDSVVVTDLRDEQVLAASIEALQGVEATYRLGEHLEQDFIDADVVIHSPAVRPDNRFLKLARDNGAEVTMEMSLFIEACRGTTVGITGSNGKTTTALLAYEMLCEVYQRGQPELQGRWAVPPSSKPSKPQTVWLGGNCGQPLLNRLDQITKGDVVVLELSSFQLQDWHRIKCSCDISLITNITPNHLDWHTDLQEYEWAKAAVYLYAHGGLFLNAAGAGLDGIREDLERKRENATFIESGSDVEIAGVHDSRVIPFGRDELKLPGEFNWQNFKCAVAIADCAMDGGVDSEKLLDGARRFRGVEHRLEYCGQVNGARCFNDSIATTPESTLAALSAFESGIHLLLGGSVKGLSFDVLADAIKNHGGIKHVYVQGANAEALMSVIGSDERVSQYDGFDEACEAAFGAIQEGDVFLMSPSSASFYEYSVGKKFTNF
ncbi:Mur ligase family protein, partial [Planctomycetota bacterium]|nr:Mur ligase family protein [Planctomycetota bacterium]